MTLTTEQKALERADGHKSIFYLSVCQPVTLLTAQVNGSLVRGTTSIPVDNGTSIDLSRIKTGMVLSVVTAYGTYKVRLVSATLSGSNPTIDGTLVVDNNSIPWGDNNDVSIMENFEPMVIPPTFDATTGISTKRGQAFANQTVQPGPLMGYMGGHKARFLGEIAASQQVAAGGDDGYINTNNDYAPNSAFVIFGNASGHDWNAWFRFSDVSIPVGATILSAKLTFISHDDRTGSLAVRVYGEKAADPAAPSSVGDYNSRTRTTALVDWNTSTAWSTGQAYETPDLTAIIQEIVDQGGWASGNAIQLFVQDNGSSDVVRLPKSYNGNPAQAALLEIEYEGAGYTLTATATPMTPGATISSYAWSSTIGTIANPTAASTTLAVAEPGEGWLYCTTTDSNGKSHTGVRHVWAHSADPFDVDYPYTDFEVGGLSLSFDGSLRASIKVWGVADFSKFVDGALVVLWRRAWFGATEGVISEIEGDAANQLFVGYIAKDSIQMDSVHGLVTFEALALPEVMKTLYMQALSIHAEATVQYWFQMPVWMTMRHMLYWLLYWHSNLLEIADWSLPASTIRKKLFSFNEGNLFAQVSDCASKLLARLGCNWAGQMFVEQDIQLLPTDAERAAVPVVSDITPADWREQATVIRRHYQVVSGVEVKAYAFDGTTITPYCSAMPGKVRAGRGMVKSYDGLMVTTQLHANQLAGRLYAADNNEYEEVRVSFSGDYSVACPFPQRWWTIDVAADDTLRGITESDMRMVPRTVNLQIDAKNGVLLADAVYEPEAVGPDGIGKTCPGIGTVDEDDSAPSWPEPVAPGSSTLAALVAFSSVQYRSDGEDEWSEWTTVAGNHGEVDKFWRQKQGTSDPSVAIAWVAGEAAISQVYADQVIDRTPQTDPDNDWSDDPAPTVGEVSFIQHVSSLFVQSRHYDLARWFNGANWRGWILELTGDGLAAAWNTLFVTADTDTYPISLAEDGEDGSRLYLTVWRAGTLYLEQWNTSTWARDLQTSLGAATISEVLARTWWAGVAAAPGDKDLLYVFGRMNAPGGLAGTRHVIKSDDGGTTWTSVINDWDTDYCPALRAMPGDNVATPLLYAIRQPV